MAAEATTLLDTTSYTVATTASAIPNAKENPFLQSSPFAQGTLYVIIFPIILGLILIYILGVLLNKYKANRQAKSVEPFIEQYEMNQPMPDNPFSDEYKLNNDSQYRRSMEYLIGNHTNQSFTTIIPENGSTLELNPPYSEPTPVQFYTPNLESQSKSDSASTSFYSAGEPTKQTQQIRATQQVPPASNHSHSRTLSSQALDEFLSTGELPLPILSQAPKRSRSPTRGSSPLRYTPIDVGLNRTVSRSPTRSPTRSYTGSPSRSPMRSPTRSPKSGALI